MPNSETVRPGLPVHFEIVAERPSLPGFAPTAAFVSQLIVGRSSPARRTGMADRAVGAYHQSATSTVRRMPEGFRKTVVS
jgi:hypothetical protein